MTRLWTFWGSSPPYPKIRLTGEAQGRNICKAEKYNHDENQDLQSLLRYTTIWVPVLGKRPRRRKTSR